MAHYSFLANSKPLHSCAFRSQQGVVNHSKVILVLCQNTVKEVFSEKTWIEIQILLTFMQLVNLWAIPQKEKIFFYQSFDFFYVVNPRCFHLQAFGRLLQALVVLL